MAPLVRLGLWGLGVSVFLDQVRPLLSDSQFTWGERRVLGMVALITFLGFGLGGWVSGRLLKASAELIDLLIDGADAAWRTADLIELQMVPTLGRIAAALERQPAPTREDSRQGSIAAIQAAISELRWDQAERLLEKFEREFPGASEARSLSGDLSKARESAIQPLHRRLESARLANDPDGVIDARDGLTQHLRGERLKELDQQVVRWLSNQIEKRVRAGTVAEDVAVLAARVADSFGDTPEGARLAEALPKLRRRAGLCPRCARPFKGTAEVCPRCAGDGAEPAQRSRSRTGVPLSGDPT